MVGDERSSAGTGLPASDRPADATGPDLASLLDLLADSGEQLVEARLALDGAEQRAERAGAESDALRAEIERMASDLAGAVARADDFHHRWLEAAAGEQAARAELQDLRSSRSWRITAPVRAVTGLRRARPPDQAP